MYIFTSRSSCQIILNCLEIKIKIIIFSFIIVVSLPDVLSVHTISHDTATIKLAWRRLSALHRPELSRRFISLSSVLKIHHRL